ncbi:auxin-binding protein ABP19a-like [Dioscorea cayenensis subsp. rotundata]|uniref:Germin-like protein n=1 Tax=Dioscorea cayennensis subsp. rotundata TaxID=55577 RepID=A0AB40CZZ1_DIOCR|nr:auxin-binding protein ABP19a-like [Dioscorea cayenensis subsp. rotundata]
MTPLQVFLFFILFSSSSSSKADLLQDFCVADLNFPQGLAGYPCKSLSNVTVDDFVFTGFRNPGNTSNINMLSITPAFVAQWPAVNGLGISVAYVEMAPGGRVPVHTHPGGTELIVVTEGTIIAGFISSSNKAYTKKLEAFEAMIFPQGLLHFQVNAGSVKAKLLVSFSSPNPGVQIISTALFGNDLSSEILEEVSSIDVAEVKKLKAMFGGTN